MTVKVIAILGAGNMGRCLVGGLIKNHYSPTHLWVANPSSQKLNFLREQYGVHTTLDNQEAIDSAEIIIFAVKPIVIPNIIHDLKKIIQIKKPLIVSVAAGMTIAHIQQALECDIAIVRCMPNIPALIGCGTTALFANEIAEEKDRNAVESIFRTIGSTVWLENEALMNPVTALSGCGPAYFFLLIDILQSVGEQLGLPADVARLLTLQTAYGAARMALESDKEAATLVQEVASPGGSTEAALRILKDYNLHEIFNIALTAATQKAVAREQQLGALGELKK